jgi:ribose 5-phosphate isomerase RpiB
VSKSLTKSIIIASDHAGFLMKEKVKIFLNKSKIKSLDVGTFSEERVDYPDYAKKLALLVKKKIFFRNINLWFWDRGLYCGK